MVNVPKMKDKTNQATEETHIQDSSRSKTQLVKPTTRKKKKIELRDCQHSTKSINTGRNYGFSK